MPVTITLPARAFADWQKDGGHHEPGASDVLVGISVVELPVCGRTEVEGAPAAVIRHPVSW